MPWCIFHGFSFPVTVPDTERHLANRDNRPSTTFVWYTHNNKENARTPRRPNVHFCIEVTCGKKLL